MSIAVLEREIIQNTLPACLCPPPWIENPYRLVSLWSLMLRQLRADSFVGCTNSITKYWHGLGHGGQMTDPGLTELASSLGELQRECETNSFNSSVNQILRIKEYFSNGSVTNQVLSQLLGELIVRVQEDLEREMFLHIPVASVMLYEPKESLFGHLVASGFPSASFDIAEAGKCLALHRSTACVFHLMRVMEIGLTALATRFNVPAAHSNWEPLLGKIEKAIAEIDKDPNRPATWKDEREFYSQCASYFRIVKDAWRNYTAHARGKYTEDEADELFRSVRSFMQKLATRLHE
jgi:hypothetical protein